MDDIFDDWGTTSSSPIYRCQEFKRIKALPRYEYPVCDLTDQYKLPGGGWKLRANQSAALQILSDQPAPYGGWFPIMVGEGKTLINVLGGKAMGCTQYGVVVPAHLKKQLVSYMLPEIREHFSVPDGMRIIKYSELQDPKKAQAALADLEALLFDEAHYLKSRKAGRTKQVIRLFKAKPQTRFVFTSGSMYKNSIEEQAHVLELALRDRSPLPRPNHYQTLKAWAGALDLRPRQGRVPAGVLRELCEPGESVVSGWGRRLRQTPGVFAPQPDAIPVGLEIKCLTKPHPPPEVSEALARLEEWRQLPDGEEVLEDLEMWRHRRDLTCGYYHRWKVKPPFQWFEARKDWNSFVSDRIQYGGLFDFPSEVEARHKKHPLLLRWKHIEAITPAEREIVWISDYLVRFADDWARKNTGIVWVPCPAFGEKMNTRFFGAGDDDILTYKKSCAATIEAHGTGKNLQHFDRCLGLVVPSGADVWEQWLGRLHRHGQKSDTVRYNVLTSTPSMVQQFKDVQAKAGHLVRKLNQPQKILQASLI